MLPKQPPWGFGVEFDWNGERQRSVFVSRSAAENFVSKPHITNGIICGLYSMDQINHDIEDAKIVAEAAPEETVREAKPAEGNPNEN